MRQLIDTERNCRVLQKATLHEIEGQVREESHQDDRPMKRTEKYDGCSRDD